MATSAQIANHCRQVVRQHSTDRGGRDPRLGRSPGEYASGKGGDRAGEGYDEDGAAGLLGGDSTGYEVSADDAE
jgi:hypothetical protein